MTFSRIAIVLALFVYCPSHASAQKRQTREEYIDRYKSIAVRHMERYGIPASITMAQGLLESDAGNSWLSIQSNNHFGIKCKRDWKGERVYYDDDARGECFRCYPTVEASYEDHAEFLDKQPRYDSLFVYAADDYRSWARGLKAAGYATAPDYALRLVRIIEECKLYLLDRPDGVRLYAEATGCAAHSGWFESQSSVGAAGAVPAGVDPDNYRTTINAHAGYDIYRTNGASYVLAKTDDTFEGIGHSFRISAGNLRRFNDVGRRAQPLAGEPVFIGRKKGRWQGVELTHTVVAGETFYSLSQTLGIRRKALERMNRRLRGRALEAGEKIRIR